VLVYSVCTFTDEEGPRQIARFLAAHADFGADGPFLQTWPHRDDADAFFAARLIRA
jgi:16S rRNA C967 or C1407 C5-methylase (RsmB/RsmF family)